MLPWGQLVYNICMTSTVAGLTYKTMIVLAFLPVLAFTQVENQATRLNQELEYLKEEASELDVYVPEDTNKNKAIWFAPNKNATNTLATDENEDSVSLGMSAVQKKNHQASEEEMNALIQEVEEVPSEFQPLKKRRLRSR